VPPLLPLAPQRGRWNQPADLGVAEPGVWDDGDFEAGTIRCRAEHDKKGFEQVVVMSDAVREAVAAQQKRSRMWWPNTYTMSCFARATTPGVFVRPLEHAEEMYNPAVNERSDGGCSR